MKTFWNRFIEFWAWVTAKFWPQFKEAFVFLVSCWACVLVSILMFRITAPEVIANADMAYWGVIGALITLVTVPIHHWFKTRQKRD